MKYTYFLQYNDNRKNKIVIHINSRIIKDGKVTVTINSEKQEKSIEELISLVCLYQTHCIENPNIMEKWEYWGKAQWIPIEITKLNDLLQGSFRIWTKEEARKVDYEEWSKWYGESKKQVKYKEHIGQIAFDTNIDIGPLGSCIEMSKRLGLGYLMKNIKWNVNDDLVLLGIIDS